MPTAPFIPDSAPFTAEQRAWLNGFFAGIFSRQPATSASAAAKPLIPLTIVWGSQTGGCERLAKRAAKEASKRGFAPLLLDVGSIDAARLAAEKHVLLITSTYGDGEPPDNARALHTALKAGSAPSLSSVRFSVCAIGDRNYVRFCQCGKDFDAFLEKLGATRIAPRVDCDLDYESKFLGWLDAALSAFGAAAAPASGLATDDDEASSTYHRGNPFPANVVTVRKLNGDGSAKEVNHIEFSLEGSDLVYEAGDALGVWPQNCPDLVDELLNVLGCDGEEAVPGVTGDLPMRTAFLQVYDLGKPTPELLELLTAVPAGQAAASASTSAPLDVLDVLFALPVKPTPVELVRRLKKLQPRLYSISSSPKAHPGQVHLTVGAVRYEAAGRTRKGACSTFLAERAVSAGKVGIFVHSNNAFRPPANGDTPAIMIGPGTGIAPFRAFLEERRAVGAKGKNWLFFGDQHEASDFLYRDELAGMQADGTLTRLDLAWSRDQATKVYVQNRMVEHAKELFAWLESGACVYVCGDASRMAKDVDAALHKVVELAGGKTTEAAADYINMLRASKRYQRDVY